MAGCPSSVITDCAELRNDGLRLRGRGSAGRCGLSRIPAGCPTRVANFRRMVMKVAESSVYVIASFDVSSV